MASSFTIDRTHSVRVYRVVYDNWNNLRFEFLDKDGNTELLLNMQGPGYNPAHQPIPVVWLDPEFNDDGAIMTTLKAAFTREAQHRNHFEDEVRALMVEDLSDKAICAIIREMIAGRPAELPEGFAENPFDDEEVS